MLLLADGVSIGHTSSVGGTPTTTATVAGFHWFGSKYGWNKYRCSGRIITFIIIIVTGVTPVIRQISATWKRPCLYGGKNGKIHSGVHPVMGSSFQWMATWVGRSFVCLGPLWQRFRLKRMEFARK